MGQVMKQDSESESDCVDQDEEVKESLLHSKESLGIGSSRMNSGSLEASDSETAIKD